MTTVSILGSTGAIGTRTIDVLQALGGSYQVAAMVAGRNVDLLVEQIRKVRPKLVGVADEETRKSLLDRLEAKERPEIVVGDDGLVECAAFPSDIVVNAVVGARGILPALAAVRRGARLALANKECLVAAGKFIKDAAALAEAEIIPVDSEHCALFQCMLAGSRDEVHQWILTASGGPFRTYSKADLEAVTVEQALRHPNWSMGKKITVDSATLMNKGLEVIEAHHLFDAPYDKISVLVHPESIVHSMVEYVDGSVLAQLATHDMKLPIQYALTFPDRVTAPWPRLNLAEIGRLTFEEPDLDRFPALRVAIESGKSGGYAPCILNAANEVAVEAFLRGQIGYRRIAALVESVISDLAGGEPKSVEDILDMDRRARAEAELLLTKG
ncbi:1-deoxy-D-xylulose-5-phosphate reductoisomerase [Alicyclobacillus acidiphilus]|uniref:1-deoxy-D-xylulose-5-phosphate reductoisomerase n=1 Tax=Alicyclobacillus acidiphilus TaxID=182455 RepID=UPI000831E0B0|nr:1-deoxy-D-xylulose-5-phosphate reductoisomerase [Alicyclobacillus acidiphilus]